MDSPNPAQLIEKFSEEHELRFLPRRKRHLGIHDGLCIDAYYLQGTIYFYFFSPSADMSGQILNEFEGFENLRQLGIPTIWVNGRLLSKNVSDPHGCIMELSKNRLNQISLDQFLSIPVALSKDFQIHGADAGIASCDFCENESPKNLLFLDGQYRVSCDTCLDDLKDHAPDGNIEVESPIEWSRAGMTLIVACVLFTLTWGWLQQQEMPGVLLLALPFIGAVAVCGAVGRTAGGITNGLRLATVAGVLISIVAGNIWGFRTVMLEQQFISWGQALELYFTFQLQVNGEAESWYFLGGVIGAWFGFGMMKSAGIIEFE